MRNLIFVFYALVAIACVVIIVTSTEPHLAPTGRMW